MYEVNEGIPNITLSSQVHWQVEVVVSVDMVLVNEVEDLLLLKFVWYVSDHYCCPSVLPSYKALKNDVVGLG